MRGLVKNWNILNRINIDNYDIILLNEIWKINDYENLILNEFKLAHIKQRSNSRGGGSAIFVRSSIKFEIINSPFIEGVLETTACKINDTVFCSLYRPPQGSNPPALT